MADKKEMSAAELGARANNPASTLREMERVAPYDARADLRAYGFATGGPVGMLPQDPDRARPVQPAPAAATSVNAEPDIERRPLAHVDAVDRLVAQTEAHERRQNAGITPEMQQMMLMLAQQQQQIAKLTELLHDQETSTKKKGKAP